MRIIWCGEKRTKEEKKNLQVHIKVQYKNNKENLNVVSCTHWRKESSFHLSTISMLNQQVCVYANRITNAAKTVKNGSWNQTKHHTALLQTQPPAGHRGNWLKAFVLLVIHIGRLIIMHSPLISTSLLTVINKQISFNLINGGWGRVTGEQPGGFTFTFGVWHWSKCWRAWKICSFYEFGIVFNFISTLSSQHTSWVLCINLWSDNVLKWSQ